MDDAHRTDRLVEKYEADAGTRKLTTKSQLVARLYSQFAGIISLRGIEAALLRHQARLYHIGAQPIRNQARPAPARDHDVKTMIAAITPP
jgi:hypothetical protein